MFINLPAGVASLARSGANPFTPAEIAERLAVLAQQLQRARVPERRLRLTEPGKWKNPVFQAKDFKIGTEADLVSGVRRLWRGPGDLSRPGEHRPRAA